MRQTQDTQKRSNLKSFIIIGLLLLLVAVIGFGGYTLSKYLTSQPANGTANVAKWGFTIDADATNLFGESYKWDGTNSVVGAGDTITVKADTAEQKVVAPGATGSMTIRLNGKSEVRAKLTLKLEGNDVNLAYDTSKTYAPIKWTFTKSVDGVKTKKENLTFAQLKTELESETQTIEVNTESNTTYTIEWKWDFHTTDENDKLDTVLGMIANGSSTNAAVNGVTVVAASTKTNIAFNLTVTVEQIQG